MKTNKQKEQKRTWKMYSLEEYWAWTQNTSTILTKLVIIKNKITNTNKEDW